MLKKIIFLGRQYMLQALIKKMLAPDFCWLYLLHIVFFYKTSPSLLEKHMGESV